MLRNLQELRCFTFLYWILDRKSRKSRERKVEKVEMCIAKSVMIEADLFVIQILAQ